MHMKFKTAWPLGWRKLKAVVIWSWKVLTLTPQAIIALLDWFLSVAERLIVLSVASAASYLGYRFVSGKASQSDSSLVLNVSQHWQILALLAIPLFYQTVRKFLDELEEAFGMKRKKKDQQSVVESGGAR
jgi:hypothetical protein